MISTESAVRRAFTDVRDSVERKHVSTKDLHLCPPVIRREVAWGKKGL